MTTDTDPRVRSAMNLAFGYADAFYRYHRSAGYKARVDGPRSALEAYLAAEFAKVPSAPVEAVPTPEGKQLEAFYAWRAEVKANILATTPPQAEPSLAQQLQQAREDFATMRALVENGGTEIARLTAELAQALAMCESLAVSVQYIANAKAAADEAHAAEMADEKAVVDCLRSELADRLQKQRATEAELQEVRMDAERHDELSRDPDGDICIDYCNAAGMLSMSFSPTGRMFYVMNAPGASQGGGAEVAPECHAILKEELRKADAAMTKEKP